MSPPKVFISYAHEGRELANSVLELSNYFRLQGIDCEIDQYEEAPPQGWPMWMASQIDNADYVLILASETYYKRSKDFLKDPKNGLGAKWETSHIIQKLYENVFNNTKYIPIYLTAENQEYILDSLRPYTHYDVSNEESKDKLAKRLLGTTPHIRPKLGGATTENNEPKPLELKARKHLFITSLIDIELWNKARWSGVAYSFAKSIDGNSDPMPIIGLGFKNPVIGKQIFDELTKRIGSDDYKNRIRLSIIKDIDPLHPNKYKMLIGPNEEYLNELLEAGKVNNHIPDSSDMGSNLFMSISRVLELQPTSNTNLEIFIKEFNKHGAFLLTNMFEKIKLEDASQFKPRFMDDPMDYIDFDNCILKTDINIKTLIELKNENPKSLDHAVLHTIDTRKIMKSARHKTDKERKAVEKRKKRAKEAKKSKKK
jgi:hypothetical protein